MEQRNLFAAIFLTILVYVVWFQLFPPKKNDVPPAVKEKSEQSLTQQNVSADKVSDINAESSTTSEIPDVQNSSQEKLISVETPLFKADFSSLGAVMKQIQLKNFKETNHPDSGLKYLIEKEVSQGTYGVSFKNQSIRGLETAIFTPDVSEDKIVVTDKKQILRFAWKSPDGIVMERFFEFSPDSYLITMKIIIRNGADQPLQDSIVVNLQNKLVEKSNISFVGPAIYMNKEVMEIKTGDIDEANHFKGDISWMAIEDRYFIMSLISGDTSESHVNLSFDEKSSYLETNMVKETGLLGPGSKKEWTFGIFAGPKIASALKNVGNDMDKIIDYGMFDIIAKPCLTLMNLIYNNVVKNYGIAIILLTILFKIILWPLGTKSYKSMNDMKKLQPLVNEIRQKHANNKQKMNEEMMNLYKTYKVNPLSGCLPLLVQMPIFFAFYKMLYSSIELRHAPFFGWITDLSAPDRLFHFNFIIPYFEPPTGIPVLTLLMGASMFLQQKMSPPAGDPAQAKMMMFMPLFMTFIFLNFSSGLVLYWLVNNIVSIIQQYYIMKKYA